MFNQFIAGRNGTLYGITPTGDLQWYRHQGFSDGRREWSNSGVGVKVGSGWGDFRVVMGSNNGVIYTIDGEGTLRWYQHQGHADGGTGWANGGAGAIVGTGFTYPRVMAGDDGVIYGIASNGDLYWYRHTGHATGARTWQNEAGVVVNSGWQSTNWAGVSSNGVIYARRANGELTWNRHIGYQDGSVSWGPGPTIGTGWQAFDWIGASNEGVLYAITPSGSLSWYRNDGIGTATDAWRNTSISDGWKAPAPSRYWWEGVGVTFHVWISTFNQKYYFYICGEESGAIQCNRGEAGAWETFTLEVVERINSTTARVRMRSAHNKYVIGLDGGGVMANSTNAGDWEIWRIEGEGVARPGKDVMFKSWRNFYIAQVFMHNHFAGIDIPPTPCALIADYTPGSEVLTTIHSLCVSWNMNRR